MTNTSNLINKLFLLTLTSILISSCTPDTSELSNRKRLGTYPMELNFQITGLSQDQRTESCCLTAH